MQVNNLTHLSSLPAFFHKHIILEINQASMNKFNFIRDGASNLPPGFRFQPTDEEIVFQYLARKIFSCPLPASVIPEFDVFALHPSNLPGDSEKDRYFFASRDRNVGRSKSSSSSRGFWKVTGSDKRIVCCSKRMPIVGIKRTLVFYQGKHPRAVRTDWFVHVYYIAMSANTACSIHQNGLSNQFRSQSKIGLFQIGKWVLCHVFLKKRSMKDDVSNHFETAEMSDEDCCSSSSSDSSVFSEVSSTSADSETGVGVGDV